MKKFLVILALGLAGCASETPNAIRPYLNGPIYYKQATCQTYQAFPKEIQRWNYEIGMYETYKTYENTVRTDCNVPSLNSLYGNM